MAVTLQELESFQHFAARKLQSGENGTTIEDLVRQWRAARDRDETNAVIRQGLADIESGNYRPLDDFVDEFRKKHNLPDDV